MKNFARASEISPRLFRGVPTGCPYLDALFEGCGGIPSLGITEVCGESGSGKTQLCMMLALRCVLPKVLGGLGGGCVFLCAEENLPTSRLGSMASTILSQFDPSKFEDAIPDVDSLLGSISVARVTDIKQLEERLVQLERMLTIEGNIKLIVIDSVAALHRDLLSRAGGFDAPERARGLLSLSATLKGFNKAFHVAVVAVNQVSDVIGRDAELEAAQMCGPASPLALPGREAAASTLAREMSAVFTNGRWIRPALGLVWDSCVTTRIMMTRPRGAIFLPLSTNLVHVMMPVYAPVTVPVTVPVSRAVSRGTTQELQNNANTSSIVGCTMINNPVGKVDTMIDDDILAGIDFDEWDKEKAEFASKQQLRQTQGRQMYLIFSPECPSAMVTYEVCNVGVKGEGPPTKLL
jgi:RecA/RadA recombinase